MLELLEDEDPGSFSHHESVAGRVEGTRGRLGTIVALGERFHVGKAADRHRRDGGFRTACDHDIRVAVLDRPICITYCMSARGASRYGSVVWAFGVEHHRDDAGSDVSDEHRDEERGDLSDSALPVDVVLLLEALQSADAATDDDADAIRVHPVPLDKVRVGHGLARRGNRVLRVLVRSLRFLPIHVVERIEAFHFSGEPNGKLRCVELGDWRGSRLPFYQGPPGRRHIVTDGGNHPHASDDDSSLHYAPTFWFR